MTERQHSRPAYWPSLKTPVAATANGPVAALPQDGQRKVAGKIAADASPWTTPFLLVLGYLLVDYGRPQDWLSPLQALRPGMLVQGAGILMLIRYKRLDFPPIARYITAFLGVMALMVPFATNNGAAFNFTWDFAIFLLGAVIPLMTFVETTRQTAIVFRFWIALNAALAFYGITHGGRGAGSFLGDENDLCLAVNVGLPYAFFMLGAARTHLGRLALLGSIGLGLAAVVSSMSRGGFIGLVTVAIACWWRSPRKITTALLVLVTAGILSLTVSTSYWDEMKTIQTADQEGDTGANRLYFWGIGWQMFLDNPVIGVGPANFQYNSYFYEDPAKAAEGFHIWGKAAHSLYFTLLPEEGVVGAILFITIAVAGWRLRRQIGVSVRALARRERSPVPAELHELYVLSRAVDVSLLAYLVTGAFISVLYYPHFWLIAAFSVVLRRTFDVEMRRLGLAAPLPTAPSPKAWRGAAPGAAR